MSPEPEPQKQKIQLKAEVDPSTIIIVNQPMVRDFSTGGGHHAGDTIIEGDTKIVTRKWQGYPPQNLNLIGKSRPAMPEVALPRFAGTAMYATRVHLPNMIWVKFLLSPHPRATVKTIDVSKAKAMPGVHYVMTKDNSPKGHPMPEELFYQGEVVAIVAGDTEDIAEDGVAAINVEYNVLPYASNLQQAMAPNPPDLSTRQRGNVVKTLFEWGDIDKGFAQADVVKEFTYFFNGGIPFPFQPLSCVADWTGDRLIIYGMAQGIYPQRAVLARQLGIPEEQIRYINKWNGGTFGGAISAAAKFYPWIATISKETKRPIKMILTKDQELTALSIKAQNLTSFKVGATKDGKIVACHRTFRVNTGANEANPNAQTAYANSAGGGGRSELYMHTFPNWREEGYLYRTNSLLVGASRSNSQQEFKWSWEQMMDEMAEACKVDPAKFRLMNLQGPGTKVALIQGGPTVHTMPEMENGTLMYDCYAGKECVEEGAKAIGWEKRNPVPGGNPGRFKCGFGMAMSQHHAGRVGYQEGEGGFDWVVNHKRSATGNDNEKPDIYEADLEMNDQGHLIMHFAQPDSGTNHSSAMAIQVSEILGYTQNLDHIRLIWGDSDLVPQAPGWNSGLTTQLQGGALNNAADKLRKDLLKRASDTLKVDAAKLQIRDAVITSSDDSKKKVTFAQLAKANGGTIKMHGRSCHPGGIGRAMNRGVGACFAEVEVDTLTGDWRYVRCVYAHDAGNVMNQLLANASMDGSLMESTGVTTDAIPWDREFPGNRHYSVGYLSYRLPTIYEPPDLTNVYINSLEPRWYFGSKGFAETCIGAPPGALANAIYNACGVRVREHPVAKDTIMAGLAELKKKGAVTA